MRLLLVSLSFTPDNSPNAYVLTPLVNGLIDLGHQVTVLTTMPHRGTNQIYEGYRGKLWNCERRENLDIHRLWVYVPEHSDWQSGTLLRWLSFNLPVTPLSLIAARKHDVVWTLSPPFTLGLTAWIVGTTHGIPYIYNAQDLYPDVAIQQGLIGEGKIASAINLVSKFIYQRAARVTVLTEGFRQNVISKGIAPHKVRVIPNLVDTEMIKPVPRQNPFSTQHGFDDKFVVMYAGNVGDSFGIETLFETVQLLQERDDILFVVGGRGSKLPELKIMCEKAGLPNVRFLPFQPREVLPQMYGSSDLQLVMQKAGLSQMSTPMKAYVIMSSGRPMLVSADADGYVADLVRKADCGIHVPPEQPQALAAAIEEAADNRDQLRIWGTHGRRYVVEHFSKEAIAASYDQLLHEVVNSTPSK